MIDFDYNATTPVKPSVREAMAPFFQEQYGNPSSVHRVGQKTKAAVEQSREDLSRILDVDPEALTITGSGSEANTLAIRGVLRPPYGKQTVVTSPVEHSSVKDTMDWLESQGAEIRRSPVQQNGQLNIDWFREQITPDVDLVSVMRVNNETGVIYPTQEIGRLCQEQGVLFHTDAVQALGKIPLSYRTLPVDMMSVTAHKIGGPKGMGALIAPKSIDVHPLVFGGHQERDRRGGTENVAGLVGFAEAACQVDPNRFDNIRQIRNRIEREIQERLDDVMVIGKESRRVANTSGIIVRGVEGEDVVMRMDMAGYAIATGSACTSGSPRPSHVIAAMELPDGYTSQSFVRISIPPNVDLQSVKSFLDEFSSCVNTLRHETLV